MTVSIIIPVYNSEKWFDKCLASIQCQTFDDYEVIIVNDGSTDDSQSIIDKYTKEDSRFKCIPKSNEGVSAARNDGLKVAKGEWITFIDSDDSISSDFLEKLTSANEEQIDFIQSGIYHIDIQNQTTKEERLENHVFSLPKELFFQATLPRITGPMAKLYKTSIIRENSITFDNALSFGEDRDFNLKYISHCTNTKSISYIGYNYSENVPNCLSSNKDYERLLNIDLDYWDKLSKLLLEKCANKEVEEYLANKLYNFYNDRFVEIARSRKRNLYSLLSTCFAHERFDWLRIHINMVRGSSLTKTVYRTKNCFITFILYRCL